MTQHEIYHFLKKHRGQFFTTKYIATLFGIAMGAVSGALKRMLKYNRIYRIKKVKVPFENWYLYGIECGMKDEEIVEIYRPKLIKSGKSISFYSSVTT
jgi:hypothetical protein